MGLKIELPSVNHSIYEYIGKGKTIRIGLMAVKNLSHSSIEKIVEERKNNGKYVSLADFLVRTGTGYEETAALIKCGAMGCFRQTRPELLRLLDIYIHRRKLLDHTANDLFMNETYALEEEVKTNINFSAAEMCRTEYETFNYMVTRHPLYFYREWVNHPSVIKAKDKEKYRGRKVKMVGWYMTSKRIRTKKGDIMKFLSLEDTTGTFEAVIFPNVYNRCAELTMSMGPYLIEGVIDSEDANNIIVEDLKVLSSMAIRESIQKDSVDHNYYGDEEKVTEEDFHLVSSLGKEKLRQAYAG